MSLIDQLVDTAPESAFVLARLERVRVHHRAFGAGWAAYLDTRPHRTRTELDGDGRGRTYMDRVDPVPIELSLILGETLYELRAALDNALYVACTLTSGQDPPPHPNHIEWPICETPADWSNKLRRLSKAVHPDLLTCLEAIQPYRAECPDWNCLRILNDLARRDRHRAIHLVTLFNDEGRAQWDRTVVSNVTPHMGVVRAGDPLLTFDYSGTEPLGPQHIDGEFAFAVDLEQVSLSIGPGMTQPARPWGDLAKRLDALHRAVWEYTISLLLEAVDVRDGAAP